MQSSTLAIKKDNFLESLSVLDLVPTRSGIPSSQIIKIDKSDIGLKLSLASEVLGTVTVKGKGKFPVELPFYLDRRLLIPFVNAAKSSKDFVFTQSDDRLILSHGSRKVIFNKLPEVSGYGKIKVDKSGDTVTFSSKQKSLVKCAMFCAAKDPSMPQLSCVYLTEKGVVMASNEISVFIGQGEKFRHSLPFPLFLLNILSHQGMNDIRFFSDRVVLEFDCGAIMQTLPDKARKEFPKKKIMKHSISADKLPEVVTIQAKKLSDSLKRFIVYLDVARRQDRTIKLEAKKGSEKLNINATTVHAKLSETVRMQDTVKTNVEVEWPIDMVAPVIEWLGNQKEQISVRYDKSSPYFICNEVVTLAVARKVNQTGRNYK